MCYDSRRMGQVSYRSAATAFVFTGLWFVLGIVFLFSPIAGSLGIRAEMFTAWLLLFFVAMGASGAMLLLASLHGLFGADSGAGRHRPARMPHASSIEHARTTRPGPARTQRR